MAVQKLKLNGYMRFKLMGQWLKNGKPGEFEDYVKAICKHHKIVYTRPNI